jgi:hypothetical protein
MSTLMSGLPLVSALQLVTKKEDPAANTKEEVKNKIQAETIILFTASSV